MWFTEVVSLFREKIDPYIDSDMTYDILTHFNYPFGKYKNAEGKNIYPTSIIEGYLETRFDREKIKNIIETIKYNRLTSEEILKRQEKQIREYTRPRKEVEKMWNDIEQDKESRYRKEIEDNPPESSMRYVSDMQLMDDDMIYEE